jgi:hypothetical protein
MLTTEPSEITTNRQISQNRDSATKVQITRPIGTPNHSTAPIEPKSVPTKTDEFMNSDDRLSEGEGRVL